MNCGRRRMPAKSACSRPSSASPSTRCRSIRASARPARPILAKNPNGRVPTLEEDGFVLWESSAILKYLSAKHPERRLCGADAKTRALVDQWICWWVGGPEAAMDALAWEMLTKPKVLNQLGFDP